MITNEELSDELVPKELADKIVNATVEFHGQIDDFYAAVGMIVVGRLVGWKVMRLVASRKCWATASKWFGDPKLLMKERGPLAHKSIGLKIADKFEEYWEYVRGHKHMALEDRRAVE